MRTRKKTANRMSARKMPKKKTARKKVVAKRKVAASKTKKKPATRKPAKRVARKKPAATKKAVAKKKPAARKRAVAKKNPVAKKTLTAKRAQPRKKTRKARRRRSALLGPLYGVKPYKARRGERYMGDGQLRHFSQVLQAWRRELMEEVDRTMHHMKDEAANFPDPNDRATQESEFGLELRTRDRERKLIRKINSALRRIEDRSYGFCEESGEEIGLKRLEARPVATLTLEAQERRELAERQYRDRDDRYR